MQPQHGPLIILNLSENYEGPEMITRMILIFG
jgi:hypothetical protein